MKFLIWLSALVSLSLPVSAFESEPQKTIPPETADVWLARLSKSLQSLNFSTSFVVVKNNHADPYHWFHGVNEDDGELEILSLLNGPRRDILRKNNVVSYIEPELPPYSIYSKVVSSPIPSILSGDIQDLTESYNFVSVGKSRVLGRSAQIVRIVPKDQHKYGHWLWLDQQSGFLLKLAIVTKKGQQLEQIQFTHLDITEQPAESLRQLDATELPKVIDIPEGYQNQQLSWQVNWLPHGFKQLSANRHRIVSTKQPVEFALFGDGLVDVSVYVMPSKEQQRSADYVLDGATVALNQVVNGLEVSVVGKIPSQTAKQIADSVSLLPR
ncbi:MucB/RseB C-terminal domain-containing protein [Thalassotalea sp. G2M2-11]|uniref:MucB/RseB C-terminal domain-containing protein n=1 Tax=Thalassotalea sp. G2M2-11 TaxID=2787627 RepID=UPI0019CF5E7C|nr:MucB/RseB C-terminal domain-containing protein [Thalassotalea sp. G2M2-11]